MDDMDVMQAIERAAGVTRVELRERFEDLRDLLNSRHEENVQRLARIEHETRHTNGRVTRHDEQIRTLFKRTDDGEPRKGVTTRDVQVAIGAIVGAEGVFRFVVWLLHAGVLSK